MQILSKRNPVVECFERRTEDCQWTCLGQTEVVRDCLNPDFIKYFVLDYRFEERTGLYFQVWDCNNNSGTLMNAEFIGRAEFCLPEIMGNHQRQVLKPLEATHRFQDQGNIIIRVVQIEASRETIHLKLHADQIKGKAGWFRTFKPFFYLARHLENSSILRVYRSEHIRGRSGTWTEVKMNMQELSNSDYRQVLSLEVRDRRSSGDHTFVGYADFSVENIVNQGLTKLQLVKNDKLRGKVKVIKAEIKKEITFLDYIVGGCQINLIAAVDFTASNGDPRKHTSLHFHNSQVYNHYEKALMAVGDILLHYDTDKLVPMYGFGGVIDGQVSHCFNLNGDSTNPNVSGMDGTNGLLQAYRSALDRVVLSGPTYFSGILQAAVREAEEAEISQQHQQYFILLILTDGQTDDLQHTIDWIVRGADSPLSIVIVGVGNDCFKNMEHLDADKYLLINSNGERMSRDIVQFVAFREHNNNPVALAREVLDEIPREIVNFFKRRNILPNAPAL